MQGEHTLALLCMSNHAACMHGSLHCPTFATKCLDPDVYDADSGLCSLDTDGDGIPDYKVRDIFSIA